MGAYFQWVVRRVERWGAIFSGKSEGWRGGGVFSVGSQKGGKVGGYFQWVVRRVER